MEVIQDEIPDRSWVLKPRAHLEEDLGITGTRGMIDLKCAKCMNAINEDQPVTCRFGEFNCRQCALAALDDHPITPTYMNWINEGDPRWWSPYICNCSGCDPQGELR